MTSRRAYSDQLIYCALLPVPTSLFISIPSSSLRLDYSDRYVSSHDLPPFFSRRRFDSARTRSAQAHFFRPFPTAHPNSAAPRNASTPFCSLLADNSALYVPAQHQFHSVRFSPTFLLSFGPAPIRLLSDYSLRPSSSPSSLGSIPSKPTTYFGLARFDTKSTQTDCSILAPSKSDYFKPTTHVCPGFFFTPRFLPTNQNPTMKEGNTDGNTQKRLR